LKAVLPPDEGPRLEALHRYGVIDASPDPDIEALARLATAVAGTQVAVINLVDADRQVQTAATGTEPRVVPRDDALCAHVVAEGRAIHVADARTDPRFADSPFVTGDLGRVRLYASTPLRTPDGHAIGTLCVTDERPGTLDEGQLAALGDLAHQVVQLFELKRHVDRLGTALAEVDHLASHDTLTGLHNRRRFVEVVDDRLRAAHRAAPLVVYCDLDGFKPVNDTFGHVVGDQVLVVVAERLAAAVRHGDAVARIGGDEFAVVCTDLHERDVAPLVTRLRAAVERPIATPEATVRVGLSVGVARAGELTTDVDGLLRHADAAMYDDKRLRKRS
jgi:diguanylate cyclase (GGDEF)-like protein